MIRIEKWLEFIAEADGEILGKGKGVTVVNYPFIDFEGVIAITAGQRKSVVNDAIDSVSIDFRSDKIYVENVVWLEDSHHVDVYQIENAFFVRRIDSYKL